MTNLFHLTREINPARIYPKRDRYFILIYFTAFIANALVCILAGLRHPFPFLPMLLVIIVIMPVTIYQMCPLKSERPSLGFGFTKITPNPTKKAQAKVPFGFTSPD